ncbi:hypothetical protein DSO57_1032495 [Entomophthora muscae]|uniref:Uncharacterized protein n=1 Tax=Entomophthora muscae TaxID=34485 RepID=A0ACC2UL52_9FUNG|nr:hypothetical protein DSO57_1032495 [Entomophthora muscae]
MYIGTTNARSMGNWATRAQKLHHYKKQKNIDILVISKIQGFNTVEYSPLDPNPMNHPWSRQANLKSLWEKHVAIVALKPHIELEFSESLDNERIIIANAKDTKTNQKLRIIGVYISPQFDECKLQWDTLDKIEMTTNTVIAGDFNTWTDKLQDTFPIRERTHRKAATMLSFMSKKGLIFTLDEEDDGPASLTRWAYDIDDTPIKGSRLDYILVVGALAEITSRSMVLTSSVSNHMIVVVQIARPENSTRHKWSIMPATLRNIEWVRLMEKTIPSQMERLKKNIKNPILDGQ